LYLQQDEDPYLEELMAEWQAVNRSADKLATAVHRMASTVAQVGLLRFQTRSKLPRVLG
jgi:hypothetical protein